MTISKKAIELIIQLIYKNREEQAYTRSSSFTVDSTYLKTKDLMISKK